MAASGARDRFVTIQAMTASVGGSGFPVETWSDLSSVWASRQDSRGGERFRADQLSAPFDTRWDVPYSGDWDPELVDVAKLRRLVHEGRAHDIVWAEQIGRKQGIALMTLARQG